MAMKALSALPIVTLATWSSAVYYQRKQVPENTEFLQGSLDELVMDSLDTGDILLFNRKCMWMQPTGAAICSLNKKLYDSRFDHWGVIIVDRMGRRHVLEHTHSGVKLRPYNARILYSYAHEITAYPLTCKRTMAIREAAEKFVKEVQARPTRSSFSLLWELVQSPLTKKLSCPDGELLCELYQQTGLMDTPSSKAFLSPPKIWMSSPYLGSPIPIRLL